MKINSLSRSDENIGSTLKINNDSSSTTCNNVTRDSVDIEYITNNESDFDDVQPKKKFLLLLKHKFLSIQMNVLRS